MHRPRIHPHFWRSAYPPRSPRHTGSPPAGHPPVQAARSPACGRACGDTPAAAHGRTGAGRRKTAYRAGLKIHVVCSKAPRRSRRVPAGRQACRVRPDRERSVPRRVPRNNGRTPPSNERPARYPPAGRAASSARSAYRPHLRQMFCTVPPGGPAAPVPQAHGLPQPRDRQACSAGCHPGRRSPVFSLCRLPLRVGLGEEFCCVDDKPRMGPPPDLPARIPRGYLKFYLASLLCGDCGGRCHLHPERGRR